MLQFFLLLCLPELALPVAMQEPVLFVGKSWFMVKPRANQIFPD